MAKNLTYVFRYDNWAHTDEETSKVVQWCNDYEVSIKYIGKQIGRKCKWLQIEVDNVITANFISRCMPLWSLYDKKE